MIALSHDGAGEIFYATRQSAGFDVCASEDIEIPPHDWRLVPTGLRIVETAGVRTITVDAQSFTILPELQIRPRSGLAVKAGISVLNSPSTIDADYRGEIKVPLINHGRETFRIHKGDRIAQGVCALVFHAPNIPVREVERGTGGFGSTGGKIGLT